MLMFTRQARRPWLSVVVLLASLIVHPSSSSGVEGGPVVSLDGLGKVRGRLDTTLVSEDEDSEPRQYVSFHRLPYARAPVGRLRFRRPRPAQSWSPDVLDATEPGPLCAQLFLGSYRGHEDCLYLNVYTPHLPATTSTSSNNDDHATLRPVMVFIPGGAFNFGSGGPEENGAGRLLNEDIVLVTFNYRVGPFGFLTTDDAAAPGNYGLYDQLAALRWVQRHIDAFGGDRQRITLFGESAGGVSVHLHMVSPMSRGLFQRAISQSATALAFWTVDSRQRPFAEQLAVATGCPASDARHMIECLREQPAQRLAELQDPLYRHWSVYPLMFAFHPRVEAPTDYVKGGDDEQDEEQSADGWPEDDGARFLPESPRALIEAGRFADIPWIVGFNRDEGGTFGCLHLLNATALQLLRDEPDRYGPVWLGLDGRTGDPAAVYHRVRQFYFGGRRQPGLSSIDQFVRAEGDRFFATSVDAATRLHARHGSAPVYKYVMEQLPTTPYPSLIAGMFDNRELADYPWGIGHKGELRFLFSGSEQPVSSVDAQFVRVLTDVWANFARTAVPFTNRTSMPEWPPYDEHRQLHMRLSMSPSVGAAAYGDRMAFWQGLPMHEDYNLGYQLPRVELDQYGSCSVDGCP